MGGWVGRCIYYGSPRAKAGEVDVVLAPLQGVVTVCMCSCTPLINDDYVDSVLRLFSRTVYAD